MKNLSVFLSLILYSDCARILGVIPTPSYSHQKAFHPIWKELSLRGHQVTTITADLIDDPTLVNLTEIDLSTVYNVIEKRLVSVTTESTLTSIFSLLDNYVEINDHILSHPAVQRLINNETEYFDVVIVEDVPSSMLSFGERFQAPIIIATSFEAVIYLHHIFGNPLHYMLYPVCLLPVHYNLLLSERVLVVLFNVFLVILSWMYGPFQDEAVKKFFGDGYSPVGSLYNEVSLVLSNSDPIFHKVKPLLPTIVEFGGDTHTIPSGSLPNELKDILDHAVNGFIYFSLGSNVKSTFLSKERRKVILETFAVLPYTVLWKFEDDYLPNKTDNVITLKWFPQRNVLRHPNIKLFITHGGLMSMDESVYEHIPLLALPFFADQQYNAFRIVEKGFGLTLDYKTMTKEKFKEAILELIKNPKYKIKLKELSELAKDQPMGGLEKAVWWIEYVIRHNGTKHLRSPYLDMPAYQYYYLDVIAIFGIGFLIVSGSLILSGKVIVKLLFKMLSTKGKFKIE